MNLGMVNIQLRYLGIADPLREREQHNIECALRTV